MPNPPNVGGVVGTDNVSPIYNPTGRWQVWNMNELYLGQEATNKYVPKVEDVVFELTGNRIVRYIVKDIDPGTMIPVLEEEEGSVNNGAFDEADVLLGVGPGTQSDTYRVYVDRSVIPYRLCVDARLKVAGTLCRWCKIFKGTNVSTTGTVISRMYDANGTLLSENIPLELAATELLTNHAIKVVSPAYTTTTLLDGEVVTAVFYDDAGFVVSKRQLLVENTGFIRSTDADKKYIVSIALKSPFLSTLNNKLIQYPLNVPLNGLNLMGVVTYSNGEVKEYPVDGTKFSIYGFEQYVATQVGQKINLILKYSLAANEVAYGAVQGGDSHISEFYEAVTMTVDGSYNIRLYGYPVWIDAVSGYRLEWYMYNLDRDIAYNVTPYVTIDTNVSVFNPLAYGQLQRLSVSLNIRQVDGSYKNYVHTQSIDIILNRPGNDRETNWLVGFSPSQNPRYGHETYATALFVSAGNWKLKLNTGLSSYSEWLDKVYRTTLPLYNPLTEAQAPEPTHFALLVDGTRIEYPISQWASELSVAANVPNSSSVFIQFFKRTNENDLQLAVAGMIVYHVDGSGNILTV